MTSPPPRYLSKKPVTRYGSVKKLTKRELLAMAKKAVHTPKKAGERDE